MAIYKYEDGSIGTAYEKNFDGEYPEVSFPSLEEVVEYIDNLNRWDDVEPELYEELCEEVGLNYSDYDDPDDMMEAVRAEMKRHRKLAIVSDVYKSETAKMKNGDRDTFFDILPEEDTLDQAIEKADAAWKSLHWRDKRKQRLFLCALDRDDDVIDVIKKFE